MSREYEDSKDVPTVAICDRLDELSDAITKGREASSREFTMRVPAEVDRDPDIVLAEAARRLRDGGVATGYLKTYEAAPFGEMGTPIESVTLTRGLDRLATLPASLLRHLIAEVGPELHYSNAGHESRQ